MTVYVGSRSGAEDGHPVVRHRRPRRGRHRRSTTARDRSALVAAAVAAAAVPWVVITVTPPVDRFELPPLAAPGMADQDAPPESVLPWMPADNTPTVPTPPVRGPVVGTPTVAPVVTPTGRTPGWVGTPSRAPGSTYRPPPAPSGGGVYPTLRPATPRPTSAPADVTVGDGSHVRPSRTPHPPARPSVRPPSPTFEVPDRSGHSEPGGRDSERPRPERAPAPSRDRGKGHDDSGEGRRDRADNRGRDRGGRDDRDHDSNRGGRDRDRGRNGHGGPRSSAPSRG